MSNKRENITENSESMAAPAKRCRKWWKRLLIALGIIALIVIVILLVVIIWLGPIAEWYIERNDTNLVGRRIEMDDLRLKIFNGKASANNIILYEADGQTPFASIEELSLKMSMSDIFKKHIHIEEVHLVNPYLRVVQDGEVSNYDDLVLFIIEQYIGEESDEAKSNDEAKSSDEVENNSDSKSSGDWKITIENVTFEGGEILYHDMAIDQRWEITAFNIHTDEFFLSDAITEAEVSMLINDSAAINGHLGLNFDSLDFTFKSNIEDFPLAETYNYLKSTMNIRNIEGAVGADTYIVGNIGDIMASDINGAINIEGLGIYAADGSELLLADNLAVDAEKINIAQQRFALHSLKATNYSTNIIYDKDGKSNFDRLFYGGPEISIETTTEHLGDDIYDVRQSVTITNTDNDEEVTEDNTTEDTPMVVTIDTLDMRGGRIYYSDATMTKKFEYDINNIAIHSNKFNIDSVNRLNIRATLQKQGSATIRWVGSLNDFYNQNLMASVANVDMKDLSPFIEHYTAFPVLTGNMTFNSQNILTNGQLNGINQLGTYNFKVGKKDKSRTPMIDLPLRAGIYILTDKDKHIDLELPVKGHIDSPEFSYRQLVMKTLANLFVKILASPFMWMSPDKQDTFRDIDFELLDPALTSEQYARIDDMIEAIHSDENISVHLVPRINYNRAKQKIAELNLKTAYYNSTQVDDSKRLDMLDFISIRQMSLSNDEMDAFASNKLLERGIDPSGMSTRNKAMAIYGDMVDEQILSLMRYRKHIITEYISFQHKEFNAEKLVIEDITIEDIKGHRGDDHYEATLYFGNDVVTIDDEAKEALEDIYGE
ncbi:MAG: DUF748 domain-containing protein [Alistipes sp.]|nr:DUF748 domain-containing protein [Alistipes sp.]